MTRIRRLWTVLVAGWLAASLPACNGEGGAGTGGSSAQALDACVSKLQACGLDTFECRAPCLAPCMVAASCWELANGTFSMEPCLASCEQMSTGGGSSPTGGGTGAGGAGSGSAGTSSGGTTSNGSGATTSSGGGDGCSPEGSYCYEDSTCCGGHCYSYSCTSQCLAANEDCYLVGNECCAGLTCTMTGAYTGVCQ